MALPGFGKKSVDHLLEAIEHSKENNLDQLLFGLGIRHCGAKVSTLLCKKFKTMSALMEVTAEEIASIYDIGSAIAIEFTNYMKLPSSIELLRKLAELGLNMTYRSAAVKTNYFTDKKCVLTGTLESMGRSEAKKLIESFGGSLSESVSKNTDILILGANPGSKYDKAKKLGIYIMEEAEFLAKRKE